VTIGSVLANTIQYAGSVQGFVEGLLQVNVVIPSNAPSGSVPIVVSIGTTSSQSGLTAVIR